MNNHAKTLYKIFFEALKETEEKDYENRFELVKYVIGTMTLSPNVLQQHEISTRISVLVDTLNITSKSLEKLRKISTASHKEDNVEMLEAIYSHLSTIDDIAHHQEDYIELLNWYSYMNQANFDEKQLQENYEEANQTRELINNGIKKLVRRTKNNLQK